MASTPERAPAFYLFISSVISIFLSSRLFFLSRGIIEGFLSLSGEFLILLLVFILCRRRKGLLLACALTSILHLCTFYRSLSGGEGETGGNRILRGKITPLSEETYEIEGEKVIFRSDEINADIHGYSAVKCTVIPLDLKNPYERTLYMKGLRGKCTGKTEVIPALLHEETLPLQLKRKLLQLLPDTLEGGIIAGILTGDKRRIPQHIRNVFSYLGIAHLLAVSGLHFGVLILCVFFLTGKIASLFSGVAKRMNPFVIPCITALPAGYFYWALTGCSPSATRAFIMSILFLLSYILMEKYSLINIISLAGFLILAIKPQLLFELSFQLSFCAIFFISLYIEKLPEISETGRGFFQKAKKYSMDLCFITIFCTAGTFPPLINSFGYISSMGVVANLFFVPFYSILILPVSFLASLLSLLFPDFSGILLAIPAFLVRISIMVAEIFYNKGTPLLFAPELPGYYVILYYTGFWLIHMSGGKLSRSIPYILFIMGLPFSIHLPAPSYKGECVKLEVSGGKAFFLNYSGRKALLLEMEAERNIPAKAITSLLVKKKLPHPQILLLKGPERKKLKIIRGLMKFYKIEEAKSIEFEPEERWLCEPK